MPLSIRFCTIDDMTDEILSKFRKGLSPVKSQIKKMILFGSRARGDFRPDSDYDLLLVVSKKDQELTTMLYNNVMDILLSTGKLLSLKIFKEEEFTRLAGIPTPFMSRILKEGKSVD